VIKSLFDSVAKEFHLCGVIATRPGTVPILGVWRPNSIDRSYVREALDWNDTVLNYIRENRVKTVFLVARWSVNIEGRPNGKIDSLIAERGFNSTNQAAAKTALENGLRRTLDELQTLGARVCLLKQVPEQIFDPQRAIVRSAYFDLEFPPKGVCIAEHDARQKNANQIIDHQTLGRQGVTVIDPSAAFFNVDGYSVIGSRLGSYYRDIDHLSDLGANEVLRPLLTSAFKQLTETKEPRR
jgi:hypothetical protein